MGQCPVILYDSDGRIVEYCQLGVQHEGDCIFGINEKGEFYNGFEYLGDW